MELKEGLFGKFMGKEIYVDNPDLQAIISSPYFMPVHCMGGSGNGDYSYLEHEDSDEYEDTIEYTCPYCNSLNPTSKYNCHHCGAPRKGN